MNQDGIIHNVIVTKDNGTVILSRYWDGSTPAERGKFEHDLYLQTRPEWAEIKAYSNETVLDDNQYKAHVAIVDEKCVIFQKRGDIVFFITGSGFYTELILSEVLQVIIEALAEMDPKHRLSSAVINDNTYGKMVAVLDQVIYMGHYCQSDITTADSRAKMKPLK